jgi:hypothetical protein
MNIHIISLLTLLSLILLACGKNKEDRRMEKPIQHLKIADITSYEKAKEVFQEETAKIKPKETLDSNSLNEIHIITYSLEKSVAYFANNLEGAQKAKAEELAVVVEEIHLDSENFRLEKTEMHLKRYIQLADAFVRSF